MKTILTLCLCIISLQLYAQTGQAFIQKALGGTGIEIGQTFMHTSDGGFIAAGASNSKDGDVSENKGGVDLWVVKLHSDLSIDWQLCVGIRRNEEGSIIRETAEGDFLVLGNTVVKPDMRDILLAKIHGTGAMKGTLAWQKTFGGTGDDQAGILEVVPTGEILIVGESNSNNGHVQGNHGGYDVWVFVLSSNGTMNWQRSIGGSRDENLVNAEYTNDGGAILSSVTLSDELPGHKGSWDALVAKVHPDPAKEWQKVMGTSGSESWMLIKEFPDGNLVFAVTAAVNDFDFQSASTGRTWVMKLSGDGQTMSWKNNYGETFGQLDDLIITNNLSIALTGTNLEVNTNEDIQVLLVNPDGSLSWRINLGGGGPDYAFVIRNTPDNGFLGLGITRSVDIFSNHSDAVNYNVYVAKLSMLGEKEWEQSFGGSGDDFLGGGSVLTYRARGPRELRFMSSYLPNNLLTDNNGDHYFMTNTNSTDGDVTGVHIPKRGGVKSDLWFVKILAGTPVTRQKEKPLKEAETFSFTHRIYPNPTRGEARLSFTAAASVPTQVDLYTIGGQKLKTVFNQSTVSGKTYTIPINEQQLKPGTYFYVITSGKQRSSGKYIKY